MVDRADTSPGQPGAEAEQEVPRLERLFKFAAPHRVHHGEIDAQGVVGSGRWLDILQHGRVEYLRNLGLLSLEGLTAPVQAVVRNTAIDYLSPARFDDSLLVRVRASILGHKSAHFEFLVDNIDTSIRHVVAQVTMVCVQVSDWRSVAWPRVWRDRLEEMEAPNLRLRQQ